MVLLQSGGAVQRNINLPLFVCKEFYLNFNDFWTVLNVNAHYIITLAACNYALKSSAISILPDETVTILVINSSITDWFIPLFFFLNVRILCGLRMYNLFRTPLPQCLSLSWIMVPLKSGVKGFHLLMTTWNGFWASHIQDSGAR